MLPVSPGHDINPKHRSPVLEMNSQECAGKGLTVGCCVKKNQFLEFAVFSGADAITMINFYQTSNVLSLKWSAGPGI